MTPALGVWGIAEGLQGKVLSYGLGDCGKALSDSHPPVELVTPRSGLGYLRSLLHVAVIMRSFWDRTGEVFSTEPRTQTSLLGGRGGGRGSESCTLASLSRIFPTLSPSTT